MRVFLDSNVVLTGAFNSSGPAGTLYRLSRKADFLYSAYVLSECDHIVGRDAPGEEMAAFASKQVRDYLASLNSELVEDYAPPAKLKTLDPNDDPVLGAAYAARADVICSYNIKNFPASSITACTPLSVQRRIGDPTIDQYIQKIILASRGTLLFFGRIHHPSSMGPIITSANGTEVICDDRGRIVLNGPSVRNIDTLKSLRGNVEFHLTIRYNESAFEAAIWNRSNSNWTKKVLTRGSATFAEDTAPVLCFVPNHRFSGTIQCISGLARYVKDKDLPRALENFSLEAVAGSLDLKPFFNSVVSRQ